ncbi:hypothetical protein NEF87_001542 [Candidatus Lokiarchaeum ossiferum]|uniref:Major facilitator superfamily (MFS) profile domain-containing protein n=1 Tax=Candidatus Lokiarchaeum ossiferum TaxID=2951803 RepID=A0ABY6HP29_9ARCH|nr:hypothetical protein NEF87_001542 [Candidatus Lokiarchaeum sp. B-35]
MIQIVFWNSLGFLFFGFIVSYVPIQLFGASGSEMGLIVSLQAFGRLLSTPLIGYLTDRVSKKKLVMVGALGRCISYIMYYLSIVLHSIPLFGAGIFTQGVLVGFFWPPFNSLVAEKSNKYFRSEAYGKRSSMIGWGSLAGSAFSFSVFTLAHHFIPDKLLIVYSPFLIFAVINIFAGLYFYRNVDEHYSFAEFKKEKIFSYNSDRNEQSELVIKNSSEGLPTQMESNKMSKKFLGAFFLLTLALMASRMNDTLAEPFLQVYLIENIIQNPTLVMLIYFPAQITSLLMAPYMGKICDRINPRVGILFLSCIGGAMTWFLIQTSSPVVFSLLLTFDFTFARANLLLMENVLSRTSQLHRGKIFGMAEWMKLLGGFFGPNIGGLVWDRVDHRAPFIISIFVEIFLVPLYWVSIFFLKPFMAEKVGKNSIIVN